MFRGSGLRRLRPEGLSLPACTNAQEMFRDAVQLVDLTGLHLPSLTGSLWGFARNAFSLVEFPALDLANVTDLGDLVYGCSLRRFRATGFRASLNLSFQSLGHGELVEVINNAGTAMGGAVLNLSSNPGTASLTGGEQAIATGKGWTLVL